MARFLKVLVSIAAVAVALVGQPVPAQAAGPTVCEFQAVMRLNPGLKVLPPSATASYDMDSTIFLCEGAITSISLFQSNGTIDDSFAFSGTFTSPNGCSGLLTGSIVAVVLTATLQSSCGSGPMVAAAVPFADLNGVILAYELVGAIVLQ